jgi:UDP-galactopyranose mutase
MSRADGAAATPPVVVIGAGPTGLSAAYHLGERCLLLDRNDRVGGWCRSLEEGGFTFDYAGHIMFSNDPYVHELYRMLVGDNVHWQEREAWIYSKGVHTRYPFQGALYGLPPEVISECIVGAIEARFGPIGAPAPARGGNGAAPNGSAAHADAPAGDPKDAEPRRAAQRSGAGFANFEEFIYGVWGRGIAKHFAVPYNRKLWAVPLDEMETSWLGGRVPIPDLREMIEGALQPVPKPMGPNARFGYVLRGGFQALMDGFLPHLRGPLELGARVVAVSVGRRTVELADGRTIPWRVLVSTMPLPELVHALGDEAPDEVVEAARGLRHVSVRCVNLGVGREKLTDKHWIYYPEDTVFHRIFVQGNASPHCNPPGGFGLTCEITYSPHKPLPCDGDALVRRCVEDCRRVGMIGADDPILVANQVDMPYAYVVYDHARARNVATIREWLADHDVLLAGRYSEWEYYNSDHAFVAGRNAARRVSELCARDEELAMPGERPQAGERPAV